MKKYKTIIADPPWQYENGACEGAAERQYAVMSNADIYALPVAELAAEDAVLLLWATFPKLREALETIAAWGFRYITGFPWIKVTSAATNLWGEFQFSVQYGVGYWARGTAELVLIATRGDVSPPPNHFVGLLSPNYEHSRKPADLYAYAETLPAPRLELFARRRRVGWDVFGNQVAGSIELCTK